MFLSEIFLTNYEFFIDSNVHSQSDFQKIFFGLITDFYEFVFLMDYYSK